MKKHHKHSVLLYGIHTINLGDDLFFKIILERYPDVRFIFYAPSIYKDILFDQKNCVVVSDSDRLVRLLKKVSRILHLPLLSLVYIYLFLRYRIKMFLIAGGSIFIEKNSNIPKVVSNIKKITRFLPKTKICIIGSNFGPCTTKEWEKQVARVLEDVDDVCFRDIQSYKTFSYLPNVRYANDIVMHCVHNETYSKQNVLCVNIRSVDKWPTLKPNKDKYLHQTKSIIEYYQTRGYRVKLISFCKSYGDNEITDELYSLLDSRKDVERLYYSGNINECLQAIITADTIIATRFHAIILGLIYKVKVIPISYSIKSENMLRTLGVWNQVYDYNEYCDADIDLLLDSSIGNYDINISDNRQFDYLDKILK